MSNLHMSTVPESNEVLAEHARRSTLEYMVETGEYPTTDIILTRLHHQGVECDVSLVRPVVSKIVTDHINGPEW